jgi:hypothetical protein
MPYNTTVPGPSIVFIAMAILIAYEQPKIKNHKIFGLVPGALLAVMAGLLINQAYGLFKARLDA